jgi:coenzyme F420-reducing hydrogenase delta subunit
MSIVCLYLSFNNHMIIKVSLMREGIRRLNLGKEQRTCVHCSCREVNKVVYILSNMQQKMKDMYRRKYIYITLSCSTKIKAKKKI